MQEFSHRSTLMGTELDIIFIDHKDHPELFTECSTIGKAYEQKFSRFLPHSELSQLNQQKEMVVSDTFWEVWNVAQKLYEMTQGAFNPLCSPATIGYTKDFKANHQNFKSDIAPFDSDFEKIKTNPDTKKISLTENQNLDFGGFLKGLVAQKISEKMSAIPGNIINLGGDVCVAGRDIDQPNFAMEIDNPIITNTSIPVLLKNGECLSTSGNYRRKWKEKHHIINPKTQDSSQQDLVSASVIGGSGAITDALATSVMVLGHKAGKKLLDTLNLKYVLIDQHGKITQNI